jgi:hypothetical protein
MSIICHHAIVVSCNDLELLRKAHKKAIDLCSSVSNITDVSFCNGFKSFLVPPDGSYEGYAGSDQGNLNRENFKKYLDEIKTPLLSWVEVQYGNSDLGIKIIDSSDKEIIDEY